MITHPPRYYTRLWLRPRRHAKAQHRAQRPDVLGQARQRWREERPRQAAFQRPAARPQRAQWQRPAAAVASTPAAHPPAAREPTPARPDLAPQLAAFQAALPGSRGDTYLQQRGIPLVLAQQLGVGYAAPGSWPHARRRFPAARQRPPRATRRLPPPRQSASGWPALYTAGRPPDG